MNLKPIDHAVYECDYSTFTQARLIEIDAEPERLEGEFKEPFRGVLFDPSALDNHLSPWPPPVPEETI